MWWSGCRSSSWSRLMSNFYCTLGGWTIIVEEVDGCISSDFLPSPWSSSPSSWPSSTAWISSSSHSHPMGYPSWHCSNHPPPPYWFLRLNIQFFPLWLEIIKHALYTFVWGGIFKGVRLSLLHHQGINLLLELRRRGVNSKLWFSLPTEITKRQLELIRGSEKNFPGKNF